MASFTPPRPLLPARPRRTTRVIAYTVLTAAALVSIFPFLWMLMTSLKTYGDAISLSFWPWPPFGTSAPIFTNFAQAIQLQGLDEFTGLPMFNRQILNSLLVCTVNVTGVLLTSTLAAYAFANLNFPGKNAIFILVLATQMIPDDLTLVPRVVMMYARYLNWYNTYLALTIPFLVSAFGIFMLRQFFLQIPKDLFDAAQIDGAGHIRYLFTVALPLAQPALFTVGLLEFIWTWNEFKWTQLVTRDSDMRTVTVGLQGFITGEAGPQVHLAMAMAVMVVAPIVVIYLLTQRVFAEGITTSGLKG